MMLSLLIAKLTLAFTFTSLPLNFYTTVSRCGCGFGFEQKYWQINGSGNKGMDRQICIPLFTSLENNGSYTTCKLKVFFVIIFTNLTEHRVPSRDIDVVESLNTDNPDTNGNQGLFNYLKRKQKCFPSSA